MKSLAMEASSSSGPSRSGEPPRSPIPGGGIDGPERPESYRLMSWLSALLGIVVALILPFFFQESSFAYLMDFVSNMRSAGTRLALMPLAMAEFVVQQWEILQSPQIQVEVLAVVGVLLQFLQFIFSRVRSRTKHWSVQCGAWVAYYMPVPHATYAMGMMQHLLYPYCLMALFFAVGLTDAMSAYTLHDSKQSMRRFAQLVLTFCYLVRFVVAFLGALFYRSTSDWHLEAISAALGLVVLCMSLRIHRMASPSSDLGKIVADHMESETKIRREYNTVTWEGYKYIVSAGSLESYDTAMSGCTYLDDTRELNCSSTLKDVCLSSALFHLLVRRYYMLDCAEANLTKTSDLVFKGLITDDVYYQRAFRVVELQLSFLHDYFYAAHSYLSSTSHLIYSILKASFLLSIICLDLSFATGTEETTAADGRARSVGAISSALLLLELLQLVSYFMSGWYAVSYMCHLAKAPSRNRSMFSECCMMLHNTISRSARFYKVGQYSLIDDLDCKTMKQRLMGLLGRPQRGTPGSSVVLSGRIIDDILNVIISVSRGISMGARSPLEHIAPLEEPQAHCGETEIHRILRWHIATWCCDRKAGSQETYYLRYKAVQLSRYCAYLVAFHPELLPVDRNDALFIFDGVVRHLKEAKLNLQGATSNIDWDQRMVNWLLGLSLEETCTQTRTSESMVILRSSGELAKQLLDISDDNIRWKSIEDFWVRMMVFLVPSRNAAAHIEYLAKGREFMTHLWALLSNAGILAWELDDGQSVATKTGDKAASSMKASPEVTTGAEPPASAEVTKAGIQRLESDHGQSVATDAVILLPRHEATNSFLKAQGAGIQQEMAGIMVSASTGVMNSLLTKLTALLGEEYKLLRNVKRDIISLQSELSSMNALLEKLADMEVHDPQTTEWRNQMREMAYDIEDCIDDYMYHLKHELDKPDGIKGFFCENIRKIKQLGARHEIAEQIQEFKVQIIEANQRRERYKLDATNNPSASRDNAEPIDPLLMALYAEAADLVGIDGPKHELTKLVYNGEQQLKVVSIVGFGGLGKTTLANQVYQQVKEQFHCSAFVSVSQKPDTKKILRTILSEIKRQECVKEEAWDEKQLIDSIRELLIDKRYFIIIDDIWSVEAWEPIKYALIDNNCHSRIMTTTRNVAVAESCCSLRGHVYNLKPLNAADSQSLFLRRVFGPQDECPLHLKEILTKIIKKCGGLPLAIITMASLLSRKSRTKEAWEGVQNSIGLEFEKNYDMKKMNMILSLSYNELPRYLKTCLLYLSIFPEDYTIERAPLLRRWMAEGFIEIVRGRTIQEVAEYYFNELINRSMIQPTNIDHNGQAHACRVHNVILDLIISKAVEENFVTFIGDQEQKLVPKDKVRRLSLDYHDKKCAIILSTDVSHVRSFSVFGGNSKQIPPLLDFQALRVFDVEGSDQLKNHHLKNIGELVQLRYIRIKANKVTKLEEQIGELQYLVTLDLINTRIRGLPASIVKLQRLKHLLTCGVKLPKGIGNMHALEELFGAYVDKSCSMNCLQELGNLTKLRVLSLRIEISGSDDEKRRYADNLVLSLSKLGRSNLRCLGLHADFEISFDSWSPRPHLLQSLSIFGFCLCNIPVWISSLTNLIDLHITVNTFTWERFKILGDLPALASLVLALKALAPEERLIIVGSGRFPCLKSFHLFCQDFGFLVMFEAGAMPKLEDAYLGAVKAQGAISTCGNAPNLGIHHLSALKHLKVMINCKDARFEEVEALEAAIRNTTNLLPEQPKLTLYRHYEEKMVMNDGGRKSSDGESGHDELEDEKSISAAS